MLRLLTVCVGVSFVAGACKSVCSAEPIIHAELLGSFPDGQSLASATESGDGVHMAAVASDGGNMQVWVDGKRGAEFGFVDEPVFSPDGNHLAYIAEKQKKWVVVRDGHSSAECDVVSEGLARVFAGRGSVGVLCADWGEEGRRR